VTSTTQRPTTAIKNEIKRYLKRNGMDTDVAYYSKSEWQARGEPFGNEADLSMTFEGPLYEAINYGEWGGFRPDGAEATIHRIAESHGYYSEQGFAWSLHFHKIS
jgi:hypothetical protein